MSSPWAKPWCGVQRGRRIAPPCRSPAAKRLVWVGVLGRGQERPASSAMNRRTVQWRSDGSMPVDAPGQEGCNGRAQRLPCQDGGVFSRTSCIKRCRVFRRRILGRRGGSHGDQYNWFRRGAVWIIGSPLGCLCDARVQSQEPGRRWRKACDRSGHQRALLRRSGEDHRW